MGKTNFFDFKESTTRRAGGGAGSGASRGPNGASAPAGKDAGASKASQAANGPRGTEPLSVSQLTRLIDDILKSVLPPVLLVKGEVSNFKPHGPSGHLYFTLKDADGKLQKIKVSEIKKRAQPVSPMPAMGPVLKPREMRDLIEYLSTLQ